MPLPEAEKDRRLYELLKTQDLQNLSYSDFQQAAQAVFVEDVNEDTLRRIVLIQLARMSVAGEWNGVLTAGGGAPSDAQYVTLATNATLTNERVLTAGANITITDAGAGSTVTIAASGGGSGAGEYGVGAVMATTDDVFVAGDAPPFGGAGAGGTAQLSTNNVNCYPFIAAKSGNVNFLTVKVTTGAANNLQIGIYADSGSGYPTTQVGGTTTLDCSVNNSIPNATPASTIALVQGTKYWMCYVWQSTFVSYNPTMSIHSTGASSGWNTAMNAAAKLSIIDVGSSNTLPATMSTSGYTSGYNKKVRIGIKYA